MSNPQEVINKRYGNVFLSKSKSLKIVSEETNGANGENFTLYNSLLDTGSVNPVVLVALVKTGNNPQNIQLKDLDWQSVHVRSYNSWDDMLRAGIDLKENNPQRPTVGALHECKDLPMVAVSESESSKTYHFNQNSDGRLTVFCAKPAIQDAGNDLPRKTSMLPWLQSNNFVYEL